MDWPQQEGSDLEDFDFEGVYDVNFTIPGPPLDIFNSPAQQPSSAARHLPRPPVAPIKFNHLKSLKSPVIDQVQSSPEYQQKVLPKASPTAYNNQNDRLSRPTLPANLKRTNSSANLVSVMQLGNPKFERLFQFKFFNQIQSQSFDDLYLSDRNVVLSAPTGSGKTVLMELAMLRMFSKKINDAKVIYIAPTKALCDERQV
jgi:superfamily II RNA helicase